jgi:mannan endo-1,4-beta-mannosidase
VTETGQEGFSNSDYWSKGIVTPFTGRKVSMVVMWRNKYVGSANSSDRHFFSVWPGHPSEDDFRTMEALPQSIFGGDMASQNVDTMPDNITVSGH